MQAFTYLIKCIPENKYYYGVRYSKNCKPEDLWKTYFTSSKKVWSLIEKYGKDSFSFEIRRVFDSRQSAIEWEEKVLRRMKVLKSEKWINRNVSGAILLSEEDQIKSVNHMNLVRKIRGWKPWNKGIKMNLSEEQRDALRERGRRMKGIPKPEGFGKKVSLAISGKAKSEEHRLKISETNKKKPLKHCSFCGRGIRSSEYNLKKHENKCSKRMLS